MSLNKVTSFRKHLGILVFTQTYSEGVSCGEHKAGTLTKLADVQAKQKKKFKATTDSKHNLPVSPNLLKREFTVLQPNMAWVGDITYIWTEEGWLYLAVVIDLYSRRVVGWSINKRMTKQLVMDAILMAIWRRKPAPGLIFHSDRGSQYCSHAFQKLLNTHAIRSSMSRKGDCWDNAVAESFFGTLKSETVFGERFETRVQAKRNLIDYIEMFYNSQRRHSFLGYLNPMEFEIKLVLQKSSLRKCPLLLDHFTLNWTNCKREFNSTDSIRSSC